MEFLASYSPPETLVECFAERSNVGGVFAVQPGKDQAASGEAPNRKFESDRGEINPEKPSAVAPCDDLANLASHRDFLLGSQERHTSRTLPVRQGGHSSVD